MYNCKINSVLIRPRKDFYFLLLTVLLMKIFLNRGIIEYTGDSIPTIVEKYGEDVFKLKATILDALFILKNK